MYQYNPIGVQLKLMRKVPEHLSVMIDSTKLIGASRIPSYA